MTSVNVGDGAGSQKNNTNELYKAGCNFVSLDPDFGYRLIPTNDHDLHIVKVQKSEKYWEGSVANSYYFDRVNLPSYLVSPELLTVIGNKIFVKKFINGKSAIMLKDEYEEHRFLAPSNDPHLDDRLCIPLTDELLCVCHKFMDKTVKYAPLGNTEHEILEQRIENFILTGRADRVISQGATGPCVEHTVDVILKENNKRIKSHNVLVGSFPKNSEPRIVDKQHRWIRVVID